MNNWKSKAFRTVYFYLVTAGLPTLASYIAIGNAPWSVLAYLCAVLLAFPVALLPGRVGNRRAVPLRVPVAAALALAMIAFGTLWALRDGQFFLRGSFWGLVCGALFFFAVREACAEVPLWTGLHGSVIGVVLYAIPGVALTFLDAPALKTCTWVLSLVFLAVTAFSMNNQNMLAGLATRRNARPPQRLVNGNRLLTVLFAAIALVVVFFGQLREACMRAANWLLWAIMYVVYKIASLLPGSGNAPTGESSGGDMSGMLDGLGETVSSPFWLAAEKVMIVLAVVLGIVLAVFAIVHVGKLIARLAKRIAAYMRRFAEETASDYTDEQEDLFDFDDLRQNARDRLQRAVRRFTDRPKKWEDMTVRERVRFCVRALYKRAGDSIPSVTSLTVREAAPRLVREGTDATAMADLYERARYSDEEIDPAEAEALKKAVRP